MSAAAPASLDGQVAALDAYGFETLGAVHRVERDGEYAVVLHAGPGSSPGQAPGSSLGQASGSGPEQAARLRLDFLDDWTIRVRLAPPGRPLAQDATYAHDPETVWPGPASLEVVVGESEVLIRTPTISVHVEREACRMRVADAAGRTLLADEAGPAWRDEAAALKTALSLGLGADDRILGLGDKPLSIDRRGHRVENWATDAFGFQRGSDPLYKAVPFIVGISDGRPWGLFVDSTRRSVFDLGTEDPGRLRVDTGGGPLDYTVFAGETPLDVLRSYARLTGRTPMLPKWALGYHQCRYSYQDETDIRTVARELRERGFGCDALYFDIHYMDGFRVFTWNREAFPDPDGLIRDLALDGFRSVCIIDPGVKADDPEYPVALEGLEAGHFCLYPDGRPFIGEVWPGPCYFPDFTAPGARDWWGDLHGPMVDQGVAGFWLDMNEPAVFTIPGLEASAATIPLVVRHDMDGSGGDHAAAHNVYGMQMSRATYEALRRLAPDKRPFIITRAMYAGTQRFATTWTGDNSASWDHLRLSIQQCLSLAASGIPFSGSDIGGFSGTPDGELFARWMQVAALTPLFRNHSAVDTPRREPWLFGEDIERVAREAVDLRYRLLPYLYTTLRDAAANGTPMLRALSLVHPADDTIRRTSPLGFYVGPDLLAQPVVEQGQTEREVYLPPRDGGWFALQSGAHHSGRTTIWAETPLDYLPVYVGAGCVLPLGPVVRHAGESIDHLDLHVYPGPARWSSNLYEDAGDGWSFEQDDYWAGTFVAEDDGRQLRIRCDVQGSRSAPAARWSVVIHGVRAAASVTIDGASLAPTSDGSAIRVETKPFRQLVIDRA